MFKDERRGKPFLEEGQCEHRHRAWSRQKWWRNSKQFFSNLMSFSIFIEFYNHHQYLIPGHCITLNRNPLAVTLQFFSLIFPKPLATTNLFSVSEFIYFWTFHIIGIIWYVVFCDWLLSPSIVFSRSILVVAYTSTSFLFMTIFPFYDYSTTYSLVDGHLGCYHFLALVNNVTMNICIQFLDSH